MGAITLVFEVFMGSQLWISRRMGFRMYTILVGEITQKAFLRRNKAVDDTPHTETEQHSGVGYSGRLINLLSTDARRAADDGA